MGNAFVLEFNEVNREILEQMVAEGRLPNFAKLLRHHKVAKSTVAESYSHLEPWIQWVTAHTGKTQAQHKAFNLSDVQHTKLQQTWDVLENKGIACGVVSPMNARRGELRKGFFIPDPWSVSDDSFPRNLQPVYKFLAERVQSHNVSLEKGGSKLSFFFSCLKSGIPLVSALKVGLAYIAARVDKRNKWKLAAELDRFLVEMSLGLQRKYATRYTSVFLNAVAHYQHHYWTQHSPEHWKKKFPKLFSKRNPVADKNLHSDDDPIAYGMKVYDDILGKTIGQMGLDSVMVVTGLSQVPFEGYKEESGFYLYRPYDHDSLFAKLNIRAARIAPLMSRDVMLYFANDVDRDSTLRRLQSVSIQGRSLFSCSSEVDSRIFCKVSYSYDVDSESQVQIDGKDILRFADYLQLITFKTGHHWPEGLIIAPKVAFEHAASAFGESVIPLADLPAMVFRMMDVNDHEQLAHSLALSPV